MQPRGNGQHVDWDSFVTAAAGAAGPGGGGKGQRGGGGGGRAEAPAYDGVGPRTSATGRHYSDQG